jgi:hypothetical protein
MPKKKKGQTKTPQFEARNSKRRTRINTLLNELQAVLCALCLEEKHLCGMDCGCKVCLDCLTSAVKLHENHKIVLCPLGCKKEMTKREINKILEDEQLEIFM